MTRFKRRGVFLTQILVALPLLAVTIAIAFQVTHRIIHFQSLANQQIQDDARMRDLVRRIQLDAEHAETAAVQPDDNGKTLQLAQIKYNVAGRTVIRTEQTAGIQPISYRWTLDAVDVHFTIERIAGVPRLVWITFVAQWPNEQGPPNEQQSSAAATIGRGGST